MIIASYNQHIGSFLPSLFGWFAHHQTLLGSTERTLSWSQITRFNLATGILSAGWMFQRRRPALRSRIWREVLPCKEISDSPRAGTRRRQNKDVSSLCAYLLRPERCSSLNKQRELTYALQGEIQNNLNSVVFAHSVPSRVSAQLRAQPFRKLTGHAIGLYLPIGPVMRDMRR